MNYDNTSQHTFDEAPDVAVFDSSQLDFTPRTVILKNFIGVLCHSGSSHGTYNMKSYSINRKDLAIYMPGQILRHDHASDDYDCSVIGFSTEFISSLGFPYNFESARLIGESPIIQLSDMEYAGALKFISMISALQPNDIPFKQEILKHLTGAAIFGFAHCVIHSSPQTPLSAEEIIVSKFFSILKTHFRSVRKVRDYADLLCVSPGHLVSVVKKRTGKTILDWIGEYVIVEAKTLLNTSGMTIQQISHTLNFPNQSFFGKYFKKHVGISPNNYRMLCSGQNFDNAGKEKI